MACVFIQFPTRQTEQGLSTVGLQGPRQVAGQPETGDSFLEAVTGERGLER